MKYLHVGESRALQVFFFGLAHFLKQKLNQNSLVQCQSSLEKAHFSPKTLHSCIKDVVLSYIDSQSHQNAKIHLSCFGSFLQTGQTLSTLLVLLSKTTWMVQHNTVVHLSKLTSLQKHSNQLSQLHFFINKQSMSKTTASQNVLAV